MKYNELRLDNWVRWDGPLHKEYGRIISMSKEEVMFGCGDLATYGELKPIRLTRKLLKQIGCQHIGKDFEGTDRFDLDDLSIEIRNKKFYEFQTGKYINSLHELQNVYYHMHNKELKIKL